MQTGSPGIRRLAALVVTQLLVASCGGIEDPELPTSRRQLFDAASPNLDLAPIWRAHLERADERTVSPPASPPAQMAQPPPPPPPPPPMPRPIWVTAYYAAWNEAALPIAQVDLSAISVLAHFAWMPTTSGGVDTSAKGNSPAQSQRVVSAVHAAGKQVVITVGGAGSAAQWRAAVSPTNRQHFVDALVQAVNANGYDGVDVDFEPLAASDAADLVPFVQALRAALGPTKLLTAAAVWVPEVWTPVLADLDQLNLMTYDLAGAYPGWQTWHNSALHSAGITFPSSTRLMPSCESKIDEATAGGAVAGKLGIGIDFYGYVWNGASAPNQSVSGVTVAANVPYSTLMDTYDVATTRHWHQGVEAPYLSLTNRFVSYDDEESIAKKVQFARDAGLGGVIVWELAGGYRASEPVGARDVLLQAVKHAAFP